jgi:hypothetical protein
MSVRLALQLASRFDSVSEEFFVKIRRAKVVNLHNRPLIRWRIRPERWRCVGLENDTGVTLKRDAHIHGNLTRLNMHSSLRLLFLYDGRPDAGVLATLCGLY